MSWGFKLAWGQRVGFKRLSSGIIYIPEEPWYLYLYTYILRYGDPACQLGNALPRILGCNISQIRIVSIVDAPFSLLGTLSPLPQINNGQPAAVSACVMGQQMPSKHDAISSSLRHGDGLGTRPRRVWAKRCWRNARKTGWAWGWFSFQGRILSNSRYLGVA